MVSSLERERPSQRSTSSRSSRAKSPALCTEWSGIARSLDQDTEFPHAAGMTETERHGTARNSSLAYTPRRIREDSSGTRDARCGPVVPAAVRTAVKSRGADSGAARLFAGAGQDIGLARIRMWPRRTGGRSRAEQMVTRISRPRSIGYRGAYQTTV